MKLKCIVEGSFKDGVMTPAKIETITIKEDLNAYVVLLVAVALTVFALAMPFLLAKVVF